MTAETIFEEQGSLAPPGPIGRAIRLALGVLCLYAFYNLVRAWSYILAYGFTIDGTNLTTLAIALWVLPPVVNIGFSINWKRWPQITIVGVSALLGAFHWFTEGVVMGQALSAFTALWAGYTFGHLGISFLIAAVIATPGCEMRAIPHLWTKLTGIATREHFCPGPLHGLDRWERGRNVEP